MPESDDEVVGRLATRHSVSPAAVQAVLAALRRGGGRMAQFSHADFGGMSQWSPGMSMVGDMFNTQLKSKLDALCMDKRRQRTGGHAPG
jgi:CelD/BcsL family acetyltransferase involved in cellulose biosynthesis